ncbi:MAG: hypothetical protein Ct9H300mP8_06340 [Gammaproteobacteria bacterium]|nr:MAG: hypothetical protein Ct9H300mP8_06340 [Gammaproteobacteria bacterium]
MALVDAVSVIESLEALEPHYLPWLDRRGALAALKEGTLPRPNSESWKYTDPAPFFDPEDDALDVEAKDTFWVFPTRPPVSSISNRTRPVK